MLKNCFSEHILCFSFQGCDDFHYGTNCANECNCGAGYADCDPVTGCVCKSGWSGTLCDRDIDECVAATRPCTESNTVCNNLFGSFKCNCQSGYQKNAQDQCVSKYC